MDLTELAEWLRTARRVCEALHIDFAVYNNQDWEALAVAASRRDEGWDGTGIRPSVAFIGAELDELPRREG